MPEPGLIYYNRKADAEAKVKPRRMSFQDVQALAEVVDRAVSNGLISEETAKRVLPMAMLEAHAGNFGVVGDVRAKDGSPLDIGYPPSPRRDKMLEGLGLKVGEDVIPVKGEGYRLVSSGNGIMDNARLMVAKLAEVEHLYGTENAVPRFNGKGKAIEVLDDGRRVPADANKYKQRVEEALGLLHQHEANRPLRETYDKLRQMYQIRRAIPQGKPVIPDSGLPFMGQ